MDSTKPLGVEFPLLVERRYGDGTKEMRRLEGPADLGRFILNCAHEDPLTMHGHYQPGWLTESRELGGPAIGGFAVEGCGRCFTWVVAAGPAFRGEARLVPK